MNWQPPPCPPPFLKWVSPLFMLMPFMLRNYNQKDIIEGFKSKLSQYRMFKDGKWEDQVDANFMSSYGNWAFAKSKRIYNLCFKFSILKCSKW